MLFGLALFVALAWSSQASLRELEAVTDARSRSRSGLLLAAEVMSALKDVETGQRGYVLTGDEHYLDPVEIGMRRLDDTFEALRAMLADRPQARLDTLWTLIDHRVALAGDHQLAVGLPDLAHGADAADHLGRPGGVGPGGPDCAIKRCSRPTR